MRLPAGKTVTLGADADVRVASTSVLPVHLELTAGEGGVTVVEAKGGALLNGVQLHGRAQVRPGDEVVVGDVTLLFQRVSAPLPAERLVWPWEAFQWRVAEAMRAGDVRSLLLSRKALPEGEGIFGAFEDKLFGLYGAAGVQAEDPFDLFGLALAKLLSLPERLDEDEQLTQDAVTLRLWSLAERLAEQRASVLVVGERGAGKATLALRAAPKAKAWTGESVAPSGALFVRRVDALDASALEQVSSALRGGRQVVATASREVSGLPFAHVITVPPLRERTVDIEPLAEVFLMRARRALGQRRAALSASVRAALLGASHPRNVAELKQVMEVAAVVTSTEEVLMEALPSSMRTRAGEVRGGNLRASMKSAEREALLHALGRTRWNVSAAARLLGLPRRTVVYRMSRLGLRRPARS